ncbi:hypothetical protein QVD17_27532 [Tagetes erecta]|uniref:Uncharacterized protein n=1 Tax=Tagetes erecta TaxID=13708 RepID=A0AAD8KB69_TARER|nr:hypothetical protein QVD17_27532 [Tagetes erecta]
MDDVMRHGGDFAGQDPPLPGGFDAGHGHYEEETAVAIANTSTHTDGFAFDQEFEVFCATISSIGLYICVTTLEQINALFQDPYFRDQLRSLNLLQNGQSSDR